MAVTDLIVHREEVLDDWVDYNGHLNVAYYVLIFDHATDALFDALGIGADYARLTNASTFVLEAHTCYRQELRRGDPIRVTSQLVGLDAKRLHYFHRMYHDTDGYLAATQEQLSIHVDLEQRRSAPFPKGAAETLAEAMAAHARLETPEGLGARIRAPGAVRT